MSYALTIQNGTNVYVPIVADGVQWETTRKSTPSKLTFKVYRDDELDITEGNVVQFMVDGKQVFYGYVFTIDDNSDREMSITAYDQLRYLKNKDSIIYSAKTCTQLLGILGKKYDLEIGKCEDTEYPTARNEDNATLFDIILNNLDETLMATGTLYVVWDDFGKLRITSIESLVIDDLLLDEETGKSYNYSTSIDKDTYNQVKLTYDNKKTGVREVYMAKDSSTQDDWGVLQYYEKVNSLTGVKEKATKLLNYYNTKSRSMELKDYVGDIRCRAGRSPIVKMKLRDKTLCNYMLIEKATHTFKDNEHTMNLSLSGNYIFEA